MRVRCLRCLPCKNFRARSWTIRLMEQEKISNNNYFLTLTLDDEHLTWAIDHPTLSKRDVQLFFKKLRKQLPENSLKYYAVGEYGETTKRPHYHMILFNTGIDNSKVLQNIIFTSWTDTYGANKGFCHVGSVTPSSVKYVSGYLEKGINDEILLEKIHREFNLMSKGIGANYVQNNFKLHQENEKFTFRHEGHDVPLPRYYAERIFSEQTRQSFAQKVSESLPKRSPTEEKNHYSALAERVRSKQSLKNKRR